MKVLNFGRKDMLKSPWGEVVLTSSYGYFFPREDVDYTPVLVHVNLEHISNYHIEMVNDLLSMAEPPMMVFTMGDRPGAITNFISRLWTWDLDNAFNAVVSLFNENVGFQDGYGTCFNNLPEDLEELFDTHLQWGKYVGEASKVAESIGSLCNKPVISLNLIGKEDDFSVVRDIIRFIPEYPSYDYKKAITTWEPVSNEQDRCYCCGKKRPPLTFFFKAQHFLCKVCERKVKDCEGGVTLTNVLAVMLKLQQERATTRQANVHKAVHELCNPFRSIFCTCGELLEPVSTANHAGTWYCQTCKSPRYIRGNRLYTITNVLGRNVVTQFEVRRGVPAKLVKSFVVNKEIYNLNDIEGNQRVPLTASVKRENNYD